MDEKLIKLVADFKRPSPQGFKAPRPPPRKAPPPRSWVRRHGWLIALVVLGACALALGIDFFRTEPAEPPRQVVAVLPSLELPLQHEETKVAEAPPEPPQLPPPQAALPPVPPAEAPIPPPIVAEKAGPPPEPPAAQPTPEPTIPSVPKAAPKPAVTVDVSKNPPPWLKFAVAASVETDKPMVAIVIDDLGIDKKRTERVIAIKGPLTLSFLPYATELPRQAASARTAGHELIVHVPMEPLGAQNNPGPGGLKTGLGPQATLKQLRWDLDRFTAYVGINNHMGSKFTADRVAMTPVIEELKARGLLFLDSRTIADTTGATLAQEMGVPNASRDVFLDNEPNSAAINARLGDVEAVARKTGMAIAIGHPHDATIDALTVWLATLPAKGFSQVPLTAIVKHRIEQTDSTSNGGSE